ncbi:MAG: dynamin family protein [Pirellulaceae bacterium]
MRYLQMLHVRAWVFILLWTLPLLVCLGIGVVAVYQTGWLAPIAWTLPPLWLLAWIVSRIWKPPQLSRFAKGDPLKAPQFWTPQDTAAIAVVEQYRAEVRDLDQTTVGDYQRYINDAQIMAQRLAEHYHAATDNNALHRVTVVEVFAVIHLAVEDLEAWLLQNIPGSTLATFGHLQRLPDLARAVDIGWTASFLATAILQPAKLLTYPIWRKSGNLSLELRDDMIRMFYQAYLRRVGYYLIEMYSGRLQDGSRQYRRKFGQMASAVHQSGGDIEQFEKLEDVGTSIAVLGQVKAGKSSLINALMRDKVTATSILPETREVTRHAFPLPNSNKLVTLLDTPGYNEVDVSRSQRQEIRKAAEAADIVLLVMAANSAARDSDVKAVETLSEYYAAHAHLNPPTIIAVLTHIDLLSPKSEWSPPYDWRQPSCPKEESMANAVRYANELFGNKIAECVCVYTGDARPGDGSVADTLVPAMLQHLDKGHAAAVLKAFYHQISEQRIEQLGKQMKRLLKSVGQSLIDRY